MEIAKLQAAPRQAAGTRAASRLRRAGKLPGIVYGHKRAAETIVVDAHEVQLLLEHGTHLVELEMGGAAQPALIKEVQFSYLGTEPVHVDFVRVSRDERVTVSVPLEFKGTPVGLNEGGLLEHDMADLEIECLATEIPSSIRVNVTDLHLGKSLHVKDLELPPNVTAISSLEAMVCSVRLKKAEVEAVAAAEGETPAGPEILTRKKEEEGEAEKEKK